MEFRTVNVSVTMMIGDLARLLRRRFEAELEKVDTGLTTGVARTLYYVWCYPGHRQASLAEIMYVEPMTLVGYLDTLEKAGLIERRQDPEDKRAKLIELTPKADPVLARILDALHRMRGRALLEVSDEERQTLEDLLQKMKDNLTPEVSKGKRK